MGGAGGVRGFMFPRSATGRSSLVPPPPWHYSGQLLTDRVPHRSGRRRRAAAATARAGGRGPRRRGRDLGRLAELQRHVRGAARPGAVAVRRDVRRRPLHLPGRTYSRCVYIWVDKDFAMVRGHHQGYPKKLGELYLTRPVNVGVAGPRLEPGGRFGATCSAYGRRLIDATFTITGTAPTAGFVNGHPMIHHRVFPAIESDGTDSLHELVTMRGYDVEVGPCYSGDATIELHESPVEELTRLAPIEMIGGFWQEVGTNWRGGTTLERPHLDVRPGTGRRPRARRRRHRRPRHVHRGRPPRHVRPAAPRRSGQLVGRGPRRRPRVLGRHPPRRPAARSAATSRRSPARRASASRRWTPRRRRPGAR